MKTRCSPRILKVFSTRLGLLRHSASWTKSWLVHCKGRHSWICRPFAIIPSNKAYIHSPLEKSYIYKMQAGKAGFFILFSDIQEKGLMFVVTYVSCDLVLFRVYYVKTLTSSFFFVEGILVFFI